jgi:hypothetical protein
MKPAKCAVATLLALIAAVAQAATEPDKLTTEPTVGIGWVVLFLVVFVGICVFIGVAAVRADRKSKSAAEE